MEKYDFHELNDVKYNVLYTKMMKEYQKEKSRNAQAIIPEMGHSGETPHKTTIPHKTTTYSTFAQKSKQKASHKRKVLKKLLNQSKSQYPYLTPKIPKFSF